MSYLAGSLLLAPSTRCPRDCDARYESCQVRAAPRNTLLNGILARSGAPAGRSLSICLCLRQPTDPALTSCRPSSGACRVCAFEGTGGSLLCCCPLSLTSQSRLYHKAFAAWLCWYLFGKCPSRGSAGSRSRLRSPAAGSFESRWRSGRRGRWHRRRRWQPRRTSARSSPSEACEKYQVSRSYLSFFLD